MGKSYSIKVKLINFSYHLVSFQPKLNNIMNTVSTDGRLQIRANDIKDCMDIQEKLKSMGVEVVEHKENNSKKKFLFIPRINIYSL